MKQAVYAKRNTACFFIQWILRKAYRTRNAVPSIKRMLC